MIAAALEYSKMAHYSADGGHYQSSSNGPDTSLRRLVKLDCRGKPRFRILGERALSSDFGYRGLRPNTNTTRTVFLDLD